MLGRDEAVLFNQAQRERSARLAGLALRASACSSSRTDMELAVILAFPEIVGDRFARHDTEGLEGLSVELEQQRNELVRALKAEDESRRRKWGLRPGIGRADAPVRRAGTGA